MTDYTWTLPANWDELLKLSDEYNAAWEWWKSLGMPIDGSFDLPVAPVVKDEYKGWACNHGPNTLEVKYPDKTIEDLIFEINHMGTNSVNIAVDQWWGIRVVGNIECYADEGDSNWIELEFKTYIEADELHDGLAETYDVWRSRWEFHTGRTWTW